MTPIPPPDFYPSSLPNPSSSLYPLLLLLFLCHPCISFSSLFPPSVHRGVDVRKGRPCVPRRDPWWEDGKRPQEGAPDPFPSCGRPGRTQGARRGNGSRGSGRLSSEDRTPKTESLTTVTPTRAPGSEPGRGPTRTSVSRVGTRPFRDPHGLGTSEILRPGSSDDGNGPGRTLREPPVTLGEEVPEWRESDLDSGRGRGPLCLRP